MSVLDMLDHLLCIGYTLYHVRSLDEYVITNFEVIYIGYSLSEVITKAFQHKMYGKINDN